MLRLEVLPAGCGDCLWIEYGEPGSTRIVIIDGGVRATANALRTRIEAARRERGVETLDVELLVVTHIDNDHILGVLEILDDSSLPLRIKEVWFNGRPQLENLPADGEGAVGLPSDLMGPDEGDTLSDLLPKRRLPWNERWKGAVVVPDRGDLPVVTLEGLRLTVLGPTLNRLYKLCAKWTDVLGGDEELVTESSLPSDYLGRNDTWPPLWQDGERHDPSPANGSSIMLLAEYGEHSLLLTADGFAPDLTAALKRVAQARGVGRLPISAFKLPHHGSAWNLTQELIESVDCSRYIISTDGSVHRHPDHQALLRILRYSARRPELLFNYAAPTTTPWRDQKADVMHDEKLQDYRTTFPVNAEEGLVLELD